MRVYLLAPDLRTRGGFEAQMSALAAGLAAEGVQVFVAIREAVAPDHPYWQRMQQAGVTLSAPPAWLARLLDPPLAWRQASMRLLLALCVPACVAADPGRAVGRARLAGCTAASGAGSSPMA